MKPSPKASASRPAIRRSVPRRMGVSLSGGRGDWGLALATGDWRLATGDWRLATGDWRLATAPVYVVEPRIPTGDCDHLTDCRPVSTLSEEPAFKVGCWL